MEIKGENISFRYNIDSDWILKDVNIFLKTNQIIGLMGSSGSGKSTLCKILTGYINNYEGDVYLDGEKVNNNGFNPIQLVFQHPEKTINPKWKMNKALNESWNPPKELLDKFGIQQSWLNRWPNELSGGELQRFAVIRALSPKTKFLIADEMTTMLDAVTQVQIWQNVINIAKKRKIGVLVVSHDKKLLNRLCDETIHLNDINNVIL